MKSGRSSEQLVVFEAGGYRWALKMAAVTRIVDEPEQDRLAELPFEVSSGERALALPSDDGELFVVVERDIAVVKAKILKLPEWLRPTGRKQGWLGIALPAETDKDDKENEQAPIIVLDHRKLKARQAKPDKAKSDKAKSDKSAAKGARP